MVGGGECPEREPEIVGVWGVGGRQVGKRLWCFLKVSIMDGDKASKGMTDRVNDFGQDWMDETSYYGQISAGAPNSDGAHGR